MHRQKKLGHPNAPNPFSKKQVPLQSPRCWQAARHHWEEAVSWVAGTECLIVLQPLSCSGEPCEGGIPVSDTFLLIANEAGQAGDLF